ncbi:MAG: IreB family regulatory phosphoprotein [Bacillota bacterium]|nr:IreB family regulatory phosphoprotein [Bacillota bacterium]
MHPRRDVREVVMGVYEAIRERGAHDPVYQIAGYLLSGEPAYITGFRGARELIQSVERHEILGELVGAYFADLGENPAEPGDSG